MLSIRIVWLIVNRFFLDIVARCDSQVCPQLVILVIFAVLDQNFRHLQKKIFVRIILHDLFEIIVINQVSVLVVLVNQVYSVISQLELYKIFIKHWSESSFLFSSEKPLSFLKNIHIVPPHYDLLVNYVVNQRTEWYIMAEPTTTPTLFY